MARRTRVDDMRDAESRLTKWSLRLYEWSGHGIGLEVHEAPYLVGSNDAPIQTGNSFSDEVSSIFFAFLSTVHQISVSDFASILRKAWNLHFGRSRGPFGGLLVREGRWGWRIVHWPGGEPLEAVMHFHKRRRLQVVLVSRT